MSNLSKSCLNGALLGIFCVKAIMCEFIFVFVACQTFDFVYEFSKNVPVCSDDKPAALRDQRVGCRGIQWCSY